MYWRGCRTQNVPRAWKIGSLCGLFMETLGCEGVWFGASRATICPLRTTEKIMAAESSSQDFREKIWGSNAMNKFDSMVCLTRFLLPPELFPKQSCCSQSRVAQISRKPGKSLTTSAVFDNFAKTVGCFYWLVKWKPSSSISWHRMWTFV